MAERGLSEAQRRLLTRIRDERGCYDDQIPDESEDDLLALFEADLLTAEPSRMNDFITITPAGRRALANQGGGDA